MMDGTDRLTRLVMIIMMEEKSGCLYVSAGHSNRCILKFPVIFGHPRSILDKQRDRDVDDWTMEPACLG